MSLNPLRDGLGKFALAASHQESAFQAEADAGLAGFQAVRQDLERRVRRGELTVKVARERAAEAAERLRELLLPRAEGFSPVPRAFLDRLVQATESRKAAKERGSLESLQRETNRLLRQTLIEQQLGSRSIEFEGQAFVRPMSGGHPAPTLDSLLRFHETAAQAGDETAMEWSRRQLEGMRSRIFTPEDTARIDTACDRPDRLNTRIVGRYVEALRGGPAESLEAFVAEAIAGHDANACAAAFLLAREAPEGGSARWVRAVLDGLGEFPEAALNVLRAWEADARADDAEAARGRAEYAVALAEADARFPGLEAPSIAEVERLERLQARPIAAPDEPIGLTLERRGLTEEERRDREVALIA
ncbi:MAG: hypothetical protein JWN86_869 [Planctomycetota bacterium]|nr:hypothetical protein [Planctomycetota bacterium]